jgi:hypothetical protein
VTYITRHMAPSLERHELTCILDTDEVKVYRMARPNDSAYRVQLTFSPEGTAIQGDVGLGAAQNGICSNLGYGLKWFVRQRGESTYLCEKFLSKTWQREVVTRDLASWLSEAQGELDTAIKAMMTEDELTREEALEEAEDERENLAAWTKIQDAWDDETSEKELHEVASALLTDFWDYSIGYDYPLSDAGWLMAIQQRFAALMSDLDTTARLQGEETA